jgi:hypothetical protein
VAEKAVPKGQAGAEQQLFAKAAIHEYAVFLAVLLSDGQEG